MEKGAGKEYLVLGDALLIEVARLTNLTWDSDKCLFKDTTGDYLNWDDMLTYPCNIKVTEGIIGQIIMFGDGTIELQYTNDYEPLNWADFKKEDLVHIINQLNSIQNEQESI